MTEVQDNPMTRFNTNADGNNPPFEPREGVTVPDELKTSEDALLRKELQGDKLVVTYDTYVAPEKNMFGRDQKLNTTWINKEFADRAPDKPVVFFIPGIGASVKEPDLVGLAYELSRATGSPTVMIDYPNAPGSSFLRPEQRKALKEDDPTPVFDLWIDAMRKAGLGGRKIHLTGESMGGFFGVHFAKRLAELHSANPDDKTLPVVTKINAVDPAGVHTYDFKGDGSSVLDPLAYTRDFMRTGTDNPFYQAPGAVSHRYTREAKGYDEPMKKQLWNMTKWFSGAFAREAGQGFPYGRIMAHGKIGETIDQLLTLDPKVELNMSNFTNSTVCPHEEFVQMVDGLNKKYRGRVHTSYWAGDSHGAIQNHERVNLLSTLAYREKGEPVNLEQREASQRIMDELSKRIEQKFNYPADPKERLDYHNIQHTSQVRQAGRKVLETILSEREVSPEERERLLNLVDIASCGHDIVQQYEISATTDANGVKAKVRHSKSTENENASSREVLALMTAENERAGHDVFSPDDAGIVSEAIRATIPHFEPGHVGQPYLNNHSSPVAVAVAIADLYAPFMNGTDCVVKSLFREVNVDILERLRDDKHIDDLPVRQSVVTRMDRWITMQQRIIPDMQRSLNERLGSLNDAERAKIAGLMKFGEASHTMEEFIVKHNAARDAGSFTTLLDLWGYYDNPDRYNPKQTKMTTEVVG